VARRLAAPHDPPALPLPEGAAREIAHSPLRRAAQTAERIAAAAEAAGSPVAGRADDGLLEIGQGEWEGLHRDEIGARFGAELAAWRRTPTSAWAPGGESLAEVAARLRPALMTLLGRLAEGGRPGTIDRDQVAGYAGHGGDGPWSIAVAHDGVFKVALLTLFDLPLERFWLFPFALCGVSVVEIVGGRPRLRAHNLTDHLGPVLEERARALAAERERSGAL
jgi:broad specificity phosphatase PhoE